MLIFTLIAALAVQTSTEATEPVTNESPIPKGAPCRRRVCYFGMNYQHQLRDDIKFSPTDIDPYLCTHIVYGFANLKGNKLVPFESKDESIDRTIGHYKKVINLKKANPELKILISVGGWTMGSGPFHQMVSTDASMNEFVTTTVQFLRQYKFDGLDLMWAYPGKIAGNKQKLTQLVQKLRKAFNQEACKCNRLLLTAAVADEKTNIDSGYEIPSLAANLDFINLMTYDMHGVWDTVTGHHSPLYKGANDTGENAQLNVDWVANYWLQRGMPKDKIVIGMPFYGKSFTLRGSNTGVGAPASPGAAGTYTRERGFITYYEICELMKTGASLKYLGDQHVPYLVSGNQWVGYDDERSLREKVRYVRDNGFGGSMVGGLNEDDFKGRFCGKWNYPLLKAIKDECTK